MDKLLQDPPRDFPGRLNVAFRSAKGDNATVVDLLTPRPAGLLLAILLICFVLRAGTSFAWTFLWGDSIVYLRAAEALEQGDLPAAFDTLGLNVYPAILLCLRATGAEWTVTATWWSVAMAGLVVLPLFGLVRRQFDDQTAIVACALYAVHPVLLGFSPLILRDATFWFLFTATLYLEWRAITEVRWWLFALAGIALTLAAYTRTEGWLLPVPLVLWCCGRWSAATGSRTRLAIGTCAALAIVPLSIALVNVTLLRGHPHWEWGNNQCIRFVVSRLSSRPTTASGAGVSPAPAAETSAPQGTDELARPLFASPIDLVGKVGSRLAKAFTYACLILGAIGLWNWRRVFLRREHQAVFVMNLLLLVAIAARNSLDGIDIRYYLPIVIVSLPFIALGFLQVVSWTAAMAQRGSRFVPRNRALCAGGLLVLLGIVGAREVIPRSYGAMQEEADLGRWIAEQFGPDCTVAASYHRLQMIEYYAQARIVRPKDFAEFSAGPLLTIMSGPPDGRPHVVLLRREWKRGEEWRPYAPILERLDELGYSRVPEDQLPQSCRQTVVLVRLP